MKKIKWIETVSGTLTTTKQKNGLFWQIDQNETGGFNLAYHDKNFRYGILEKSVFQTLEEAKLEVELLIDNPKKKLIKNKNLSNI